MKSKSATGPAPESQSPILTGSEILLRSLMDNGVDTIFGYPGGKVIALYDTLFKTTGLRHILVRHEQGAAHAADGYARTTGRPGVVLVTSGPGATNTVTGIATAYMDSIPIIVISGQVSYNMIGNDAFQEADIIGITRPITKHSYLISDVGQIAQAVHEAFHIATTGRPGPVLIDLPSDMMTAKAPYQKIEGVSIRGYNPTLKGHSQQITKAAQLIQNAKRPLLYVGGGVILGDASESLTELAVKGNLPVTTTLMGLGAFPETHELSLGMLGMHGTWAANMAIQEADVVVCVGARFDDRVTGRLDRFASGSKKIQIDIDPACIAKNVAVDIPIVGHVREVLPKLVEAFKPGDTQAWLDQLNAWKTAHPLKYEFKSGVILPQQVIETVSKVTGGDAIVVTDVGQNQMWTAQYYRFTKPRTSITSGGLGTMGYGLPAAVGAAIGCPGRTVFCITGDGGIQMNVQELATAVQNRLPLKIVILNNGYLGMVRQWQELFYEKRYSSTFIREGNPDFVKLAESFGAVGVRVQRPEDTEPALRRSLEVMDRPVVLDFIVSPEEKVMPIVPPGASLEQMLED
jgi:acetolactate synthase-1/2/3 large subunit